MPAQTNVVGSPQRKAPDGEYLEVDQVCLWIAQNLHRAVGMSMSHKDPVRSSIRSSFLPREQVFSHRCMKANSIFQYINNHSWYLMILRP